MGSIPIAAAAVAPLADDGYDLFYSRSHPEPCHCDGQFAYSAWLHEQMIR